MTSVCSNVSFQGYPDKNKTLYSLDFPHNISDIEVNFYDFSDATNRIKVLEAGSLLSKQSLDCTFKQELIKVESEGSGLEDSKENTNDTMLELSVNVTNRGFQEFKII